MPEALKGFNDVLPAGVDPFLDSLTWQRLQALSARVFGAHGYRPVWLPIAEATALFARGLGSETDIVAKEMYNFVDRGGREMTLRPEGTAGAVRAYIERELPRHAPQQKWWYMGPMFRAERPQKGRYRQFYQVGAELLGVAGPACEAEMLAMLQGWLAAVGGAAPQLRLGTLGDAESRAAYLGQLRPFLAEHADRLCVACRARATRNPLRVLDCKEPGCRALLSTAPRLHDALTAAARGHAERLQELLAALEVPFVVAPDLVRGLDYYTGTVFEFVTDQLGAQDAVVGGGRYDTLVEQLGGPPTPAVGFAAGVERLTWLASGQDMAPPGPLLYVAPLDAASEAVALRLAQALRGLGPWSIEVDLAGGRAKQQLRRADRARARLCLVVGSDELESGEGTLKDLRGGEGGQRVLLRAPALAETLAAIQ